MRGTGMVLWADSSSVWGCKNPKFAPEWVKLETFLGIPKRAGPVD
jgi:hypothetical protein